METGNGKFDLSDQQLAEFREAFMLFDRDGDNAISVDELGTVMRSLGQNPTLAEVAQIIAEVDSDSSGSMSFPAFVQMMSTQARNVDHNQELLEAFRVFDHNGDGFVCAQELRHLMTTLGDLLPAEEVDEMIREAGGNGDGRIKYADFAKVMQEGPCTRSHRCT